MARPEYRGQHEMFWVSLQPHLLSRGYRLRPRYDPNWIPSWTNSPGKDPYSCEDSLITRSRLLDGTRISDNVKVVFKPVATSQAELPIAMLLSSQKMRADPRNCAAPILDVVLIPGNDDLALMVMPMLRDIYDIPFRRVGEIVEMAEHFLYCLQFLHENNIVHMDFSRLNLMMDASRIIPRGWNFCRPCTHNGFYSEGKLEWNDRWSVHPVQYYLIDFELSFQPKSASSKVMGNWGQDRTVPEMSLNVPCDPFKVDVYQIGNAIKGYIDEYTGIRVLDSLVDRMTTSDPVKRFTADEAVQHFQECKAKWSKWTMKSRIWKTDTSFKRRFKIQYLGDNSLIPHWRDSM
ncbi:hypothetical protein M413DRAFT_447205 [Hebeloma cylindrosporum]|uniref:Uncharacterized protein n=1 Tax=Hebeloma cylindrosporum TaxID=76867 RepID=A0A0C2YE14_HEBCY|nr:hypothetical protein M413DRAFT_447205 [Hebeloma cylindrosporum h7]